MVEVESAVSAYLILPFLCLQNVHVEKTPIFVWGYALLYQF